MSQAVADQARSDRISQLMGQNLLKGFALLDDYCNVCETPLMRDPQRNLLCVACQLKRESDRRADSLALDAKETIVIPTKGAHDFETTLQAKLEWAVSQLRVAADVKQCIELTVLVKGLAECMKLLREVN